MWFGDLCFCAYSVKKLLIGVVMSQPQIIEYDEHEIEYEVKYLSANDLKVAASILYNAYFQDPLFVDIFTGSHAAIFVFAQSSW